MNSRERILAAIDHTEPDRVPLDIGATPSSGFSAIAYSNLCHYLKVDGEVKIYDVVQQLAEPEDWCLNRFGIDVVDVARACHRSPTDWKKSILPDGSPALIPEWFNPQETASGEKQVFDESGDMLARMPQGATFYDQTFFPYLEDYPDEYSGLPVAMQKVLWSYLAQSPWQHAARPEFWQELRRICLELRANTDRALFMGLGCNMFEWGTFLRRIDNFLMDIVAEPEEVEPLLDALLAIHLQTLEKACHYLGDIIDIFRFGDDLGMSTGPFMSPQTYRRLFKPRHTQLVTYLKEHSNAKAFLHSCGSIYKLLPDLIEVGYDIINPVQTNCTDMEPRRLKQEFGASITFWGGGADTSTILNHGSPAEVRRHVLERLEIFSPGGGYIFNSIHNIMPDVPPVNIIAMLNALREFNGQPEIAPIS